MKTISTKIDFTQPEKKRVLAVGDKLANGVRVSYRALCKRLIMKCVEIIESEV